MLVGPASGLPFITNKCIGLYMNHQNLYSLVRRTKHTREANSMPSRPLFAEIFPLGGICIVATTHPYKLRTYSLLLANQIEPMTDCEACQINTVQELQYICENTLVVPTTTTRDLSHTHAVRLE